MFLLLSVHGKLAYVVLWSRVWIDEFGTVGTGLRTETSASGHRVLLIQWLKSFQLGQRLSRL
jgi:hypothetical protein